MLIGTRKNRRNPTTMSDVELVKLAINEDASGKDRHKARLTLTRRAAQRGMKV